MAEKSNGNQAVLLEILDSWPRLGKLLLLSIVIAGLLWLTAYLIFKQLPSSTRELQIGPSHILFQSKDGGSSVVVVSPQGWNRTGIHVSEGSSLKIQAGGRVYFDLASLNRALEAREKAEEAVRKRVKAPEGTYAPEDYFTSEEKAGMMPPWHWSGPAGVPEAEMAAHANSQRRQRIILPSATYGALIGALSEVDSDPDAGSELEKQLVSVAFRVGSSYEKRATRSGHLYFNVNDVQSNLSPGFFFTDNIGAYYVKIEVSAK